MADDLHRVCFMSHRGARRLREDRQRLMDELDGGIELLEDASEWIEFDNGGPFKAETSTINLDADPEFESLIERCEPIEPRRRPRAPSQARPRFPSHGPTLPRMRADNRPARPPPLPRRESRITTVEQERAQVMIVRGRLEQPPPNARLIDRRPAGNSDLDSLLDEMMQIIRGSEEPVTGSRPIQMDPLRRR